MNTKIWLDTSNYVIPEGCRPTKNLMVPAIGLYHGARYIRINTDGSVTCGDNEIADSIMVSATWLVD